MGEDFIRTARAKGVRSDVLFRHGLRYGVTAMVTMFGLDLGQLIGGAMLVETVFNLPGLGSYSMRAVHHGDLYALMDVTLIVGIAIALANLAVDLLYARIDPRASYA